MEIKQWDESVSVLVKHLGGLPGWLVKPQEMQV